MAVQTASDSPAFRACLDVGHAHLFSGDAPAWVKGLGNRIAYVHLHDNEGAWDVHRPPGEGTAGVREALVALDRLEPRPRMCLEIHSEGGVRKGLAWLDAEGFLGRGGD